MLDKMHKKKAPFAEMCRNRCPMSNLISYMNAKPCSIVNMTHICADVAFHNSGVCCDIDADVFEDR